MPGVEEDTFVATLPPTVDAAPNRTRRTTLTAIRWLRVIAIAEGVSYLVLLGGAMPLKYGLGWPIAVQVTGSLHGGLFVLYVAAVAIVAILRRWSIRRWLVNLAASILPFGPFLVDASLRREEESLRTATTP